MEGMEIIVVQVKLLGSIGSVRGFHGGIGGQLLAGWSWLCFAISLPEATEENAVCRIVLGATCVCCVHGLTRSGVCPSTIFGQRRC